MKTNAAILYRINEPLDVDEVEIPILDPGQVLVQVAYSGLCHSQINEIHGLKGEDRFLPHTLGHEGSGIVEAVGANVKKVKPGQRVVATWIQGTGLNASSTVYKKRNGTVINSGPIATFIENAVIAENRLVPISETMPLREAALLGCAIPTGAGIIFNCASQMSLKRIAVFGAGGVGLSAVIAAHSKGVQEIIVVDIATSKLQQALLLGASHVVDASKDDPTAEILRITEGNGVDCAIESAGTRATMETAFRVTRCNGGLCVLAGNLPHGQTISINPMELIQGKRLIGTWGGDTDPDRDIPMYASKYLAGQMKLKELITNEYPLQQINLACEDLEQQRVGRAVIKLADL